MQWQAGGSASFLAAVIRFFAGAFLHFPRSSVSVMRLASAVLRFFRFFFTCSLEIAEQQSCNGRPGEAHLFWRPLSVSSQVRFFTLPTFICLRDASCLCSAAFLQNFFTCSREIAEQQQQDTERSARSTRAALEEVVTTRVALCMRVLVCGLSMCVCASWSGRGSTLPLRDALSLFTRHTHMAHCIWE